MLTPTQLKSREGKLTASRVGVLMSGNSEKVLTLWEVMTGQREDDDLSDVWAVQLGTATEALNLAWYARKVAPVTRSGEVVVCKHAEWAACTLDGFDAKLPGPIECKHVGGYEPRETVIARYQPQFHWQMLCTNTRSLAASIIEGAREPVIEAIAFDTEYARELWDRAEQFMRCVDDLVPPVSLPEVAASIVQTMRTVSMEGNNAWSSHAADWLKNYAASKSFDKAAKEIKALVESDVALASGHGIVCKRSKAGSLSISAAKG